MSDIAASLPPLAECPQCLAYGEVEDAYLAMLTARQNRRATRRIADAAATYQKLADAAPRQTHFHDEHGGV